MLKFGNKNAKKVKFVRKFDHNKSIVTLVSNFDEIFL